MFSFFSYREKSIILNSFIIFGNITYTNYNNIIHMAFFRKSIHILN